MKQPGISSLAPSSHPVLIARVLLLALVLALPWAAPAAASDKAELDDRVRRAADVFRELHEGSDSRIPEDLIERSRCIAVVPNVLKAAGFLGVNYGRGVLTCRASNGDWSPLVHVLLTGGSLGFQFGATSTDVVLFFMSAGSVRSLIENKVKLSAEGGVAAGPIGRETQAGVDVNFRAPIYSYARSRGVFAGVSLSGSYLGVDLDDTAEYYGKEWSASDVLFENKVSSVPKSAWVFLGVLPRDTPALREEAIAPRGAKPAAPGTDAPGQPRLR